MLVANLPCQPPQLPPEAGRLLALPGVTINTPNRMGTALSALGDINGDLADDFLVAGTNTLMAYSGRTGVQIWRASVPYVQPLRLPVLASPDRLRRDRPAAPGRAAAEL
jgi:hypothetical protein